MKENNKLKSKVFKSASDYCQWFNNNEGYGNIAVANMVISSCNEIIVFYFSSKVL